LSQVKAIRIARDFVAARCPVADLTTSRSCMERHRCRRGILVTRDTPALDDASLLVVPLRDFSLAF
jgi:hypothetical protein